MSKKAYFATAGIVFSAVTFAQTPPVLHAPGGIEFVHITAGCFEMGANSTSRPAPGERPQTPRPDETPLHTVCIDAFWIGRHEISRAQWQRVMQNLPEPVDNPQRPITHVTRDAALEFITRINTQGGAMHLRLPTEAEWEYACRAGGEQLQPESQENAMLSNYAWYQLPRRDNPTTRDVATLTPNSWGLHDMLGNVLEWVQDSYLENGYALHTQRNPVVTQDVGRYVLRGGSFRSDAWNTRCGARAWSVPGERLEGAGLRVAADAQTK